MARAALGAALLATTLLARPVLAEKARRDVRLTIDDCRSSGLDLDAAYAAASLELGLADARRAAKTDAGGVELNATMLCEGGVKARLTLHTTNSSAARTISLDDVSTKDRPRVLALALAELVRAEWRWVTTGEGDAAETPSGDERRTGSGKNGGEQSTRPSAGAASHEPRTALAASTRADAGPTSDEPSPEAAEGLQLELLARVRALPAGKHLMYGAAAGPRWRRWSGTVEGLFGKARSDLGTASTGTASVRVGFEFLRFGGRFRIGIEPSAAAGATWLSGTAANVRVQVSNTTGLYADVRLVLRAELRASLLSPTLYLEGGRAAGLEATAGGSTFAATGGWFAGGALGVVIGGAER